MVDEREQRGAALRAAHGLGEPSRVALVDALRGDEERTGASAPHYRRGERTSVGIADVRVSAS
jgi:hypothetical protein